MRVEHLRTVRLYGVLGAKFGRVHRLAVNSSREAIRALSIVLPGFEAFLCDSEAQGLTYAVFNGRRNLSPEQFGDPPGADDIRIAPIVQGSKSGGLFATVTGAVLFAVGAFSGQPWLMAIGAGMAFGGVAMMLSPVPSGLGVEDSPNNRPSYAFNGPVNTSVQGGPVPLIYGRGFIGSAVISAGIYAEDQL